MQADQDNTESNNNSRRKFIQTSLLTLGSLLTWNKSSLLAEDRNTVGKKLRQSAIRKDYKSNIQHISNTDEDLLGISAVYTKGLKHNNIGEADLKEYAKYLAMIENQNFANMDNLEIGIRAFKNPQAGKAYGLEGVDSHSVTLSPAPKFSSNETASEQAELYWQALLRDVNFTDYDSDTTVQEAVADLTRFDKFKGPKENGAVSAKSLFRGQTPDSLKGPYISQYLLKEVNMGSLLIEQKQRTTLSMDYGISFEEWLSIQDGQIRKIIPNFDPTRRYIRNGRDLAWYVYNDRAYQPFFMAAGTLVDANLITAPLLELRYNPGNPYRKLTGTEGFVTFGESHIFHLLAQASFVALKAAWYQKWYVHRRLRPEEFGGRVHAVRTGLKNYPINDLLLDSPALEYVYNANGTYLLPQAYIEGSPMHPAYPSGHASVAGACATIIKAFFDEDFPFDDPKIPNSTGTALVDYNQDDAGSMTIGQEINKLANNIAIGRNFAGIHYRSDYWAGLTLGEEVAIKLLKQQAGLYSEKYHFEFTKFNGQKILIRGVKI